jgi:hypothetical protein
VAEAPETIRPALPFRRRGIDSDNGSEFIHDHLCRYCQAQGIQFTRGRPYQKDDNAHIEPKNGTHVRRLLGYVCYDRAEAREAIHRQEHVGSRLRRHYQAPQTPRQRLLASGAADPVKRAELQHRGDGLDPFQLWAALEVQLKKIFALSREAPCPRRRPFPESTSRSAPLARQRPSLKPHSRGCSRAGARVRIRGKKQSRSAVEMTRRGKRGKVKKPKRVSHAFLRAWKSGKSQNAGFPHSPSAGGYG